GGNSVGSVLFESEPHIENDGPSSQSRSQISRSRSRSSSPVKNANLGSVPLLPLHDNSRSVTADPATGWRIGEGASEERTWSGGWSEGGKLGWWLWSTEKGWEAYVGFLVALYAFTSLAL